MNPTPIQTETLLTALADSILQALSFQAEHRRTQYRQQRRRALLQAGAVQAFKAAYAHSNALKTETTDHPQYQLIAALRGALHQYQGAYWAWKETANADNLGELEKHTTTLRRTALAVKKKI